MLRHVGYDLLLLTIQPPFSVLFCFRENVIWLLLRNKYCLHEAVTVRLVDNTNIDSLCILQHGNLHIGRMSINSPPTPPPNAWSIDQNFSHIPCNLFYICSGPNIFSKLLLYLPLPLVVCSLHAPHTLRHEHATLLYVNIFPLTLNPVPRNLSFLISLPKVKRRDVSFLTMCLKFSIMPSVV